MHISLQEARELFKNPEVKKDEDVEVVCLILFFIILLAIF